MKKISLALALLTSLAFTACTTTTTTTAGNTAGTAINTASSIGTNIFKAAVDQQCRTQLNNQSAWKVAASVLGSEQKTVLENKVCGCVSEKAPQQVTLGEMTQAAIDSNARATIVANTVVKTLQACYSEFVK
ncbi:MAG: hypothetical protein Q4D05_05755 [Acinetobacter sp.]|nr:hypothetical protein [Acinetobacter sp.]